MRTSAITIALVMATIVNAYAADTQLIDPVIQALGQMVQEAQGREAQALTRSYAAQEQVKLLQGQLAAEKKRADDAEAKLDAAKP